MIVVCGVPKLASASSQVSRLTKENLDAGLGLADVDAVLGLADGKALTGVLILKLKWIAADF